ncbi:MAG: hypothetical protein EXS48_00225, partial [Candidatus Staskawiczbacteria bacterium]|nr:hypothetical protein [Candidatus Staskawiczbacteria bacterium]
MSNQYGIDIKTLDKFIAQPVFEKYNWGEHAVLFNEPAFRLEIVRIVAGASVDMEGDANFEVTVWIEEGKGNIAGAELTAFELITLPSGQKWSIIAQEPITAYLFYGPPSAGSDYGKKAKPFDYREKYWGNIQSIISKEYAGKRMLVKKGTNASLEFHCQKTEGYYIHSGNLLLRLRAGRGEDKFFELKKGTTSFTPPGLMHQRGGLEDTVIIEISTKDDDGDSFLVEDGKGRPMP